MLEQSVGCSTLKKCWERYTSIPCRCRHSLSSLSLTLSHCATIKALLYRCTPNRLRFDINWIALPIDIKIDIEATQNLDLKWKYSARNFILVRRERPPSFKQSSVDTYLSLSFPSSTYHENERLRNHHLSMWAYTSFILILNQHCSSLKINSLHYFTLALGLGVAQLST